MKQYQSACQQSLIFKISFFASENLHSDCKDAKFLLPADEASFERAGAAFLPTASVSILSRSEGF